MTTSISLDRANDNHHLHPRLHVTYLGPPLTTRQYCGATALTVLRQIVDGKGPHANATHAVIVLGSRAALTE